MLDAVLAHALRPLDPPLALERADAWWADHRAATRELARPIDRAIVGATRVDRLGFAFAGGYAAALRAMVPSLPDDVLASFAATETGGAHPRAILTTLTGDGDCFVLDGHKRWVTLGPDGGVILVVARLAEPSGDRPTLRVVRVDAHAPGVTLTALPEAPFVPEIPHAEIRLAQVRVAPGNVLPGDGYDAYLKPFRTIEDIHVHAAVLAWVLAVATRARWPAPLRERLAAALVTARALADASPSRPETHAALGGLIATTRALLAECEPSWSLTDEPTRTRWQRDRVLLDVATKARVARLASAWERLS